MCWFIWKMPCISCNIIWSTLCMFYNNTPYNNMFLLYSSNLKFQTVYTCLIQWKLSITRSLGAGHFVCYIRYFVISVVNKKKQKTKEINSLGPDKLVCYIRYFVISDLFIHWASNETYHFFRVTLTKIHSIKINHIWTQISFNTS